jgi:hypothetical protein
MNRLKREDIDVGRRDDGLTGDERKELTILRRENNRLKLKATLFSKGAIHSTGQRNSCSSLIAGVL